MYYILLTIANSRLYAGKYLYNSNLKPHSRKFTTLKGSFIIASIALSVNLTPQNRTSQLQNGRLTAHHPQKTGTVTHLTRSRRRWTVLPLGETFLDKSCSISYSSDVHGGPVRRLFPFKIRLFRHRRFGCADRSLAAAISAVDYSIS